MPNLLSSLAVTGWLALAMFLPSCATTPPADSAPAQVAPPAQAQPAAPAAPAVPATMKCPMMDMMEKMKQGGMAHGQTQSADPVIRGYAEANERMHRDMGFALSGDADQDFLRGMIPPTRGP